MPDTFNKNKFIVFQTIEEVYSRPNYCASLKRENLVLRKIIGSYSLDELIPCGLPFCHRKHKNALVLQMENEMEVNVGRDCCESKFGLIFSEHAREFDRWKKQRSSWEIIKDFQQNVEDIEKQLEELDIDKNGNFYLRSITNLRQLLTPNLVGVLNRKSLSGEVDLFQENKIYGRDAELTEAMKNYDLGNREDGDEQSRLKDVAFVKEKVGVLYGLGVFKIHSQSISTMKNSINNKLDIVRQVDIDNLDLQTIKKVIEIRNQVEKVIMEYTEFIESAEKFFTQQNFQMLPYISKSKEEIERLKGINWCFQTGTGKIKIKRTKQFNQEVIELMNKNVA